MVNVVHVVNVDDVKNVDDENYFAASVYDKNKRAFKFHLTIK